MLLYSCLDIILLQTVIYFESFDSDAFLSFLFVFIDVVDEGKRNLFRMKDSLNIVASLLMESQSAGIVYARADHEEYIEGKQNILHQHGQHNTVKSYVLEAFRHRRVFVLHVSDHR